ncbi:hypothetical protein R5W60_05350 [Brucella pseudintermedia]|uniref:hypothetical protein n=1 Tax=Brucella pseudintermedia TaxID=370111 RepID=UPI00366DFA5A|nr:hypothetical protein R5W60_04025 [Brucella pseudintermedia]WPM81123.1 hypothetical protein R5W60_05350 [Brucella pseudintermedia]
MMADAQAMTDRIPDETMREAIKICDPSFSGGTRVNDAQHIVDVARALMARDQRAAGIALAHGENSLDGQYWAGVNQAAVSISNAILSYDEVHP